MVAEMVLVNGFLGRLVAVENSQAIFADRVSDVVAELA